MNLLRTFPRIPARAPARTPLAMRLALPEDALALERLAALDSTRAPRGVVLIAEVDGEPWAAVSLDDGHLAADPFRPTGELALQLVDRARGLRRELRGERAARAPRVWPSDHTPRLAA
jgi:hypothetical protein